MRNISIAAGIGLALLGSCAPRREAPAPAPPPPRPAPVQPVRPPPPPPPLDWQDAAIAPGDWSYRDEGGGSSATFGAGAPLFVVRCEPGRQVTLGRTGAGGNALTIRTTESARSVAAAPAGGALVARLNPGDPLLDAMVFSRGRFAVEAAGAPLLVVPTWPEPARVIEDCRG